MYSVQEINVQDRSLIFLILCQVHFGLYMESIAVIDLLNHNEDSVDQILHLGWWEKLLNDIIYYVSLNFALFNCFMT